MVTFVLCNTRVHQHGGRPRRFTVTVLQQLANRVNSGTNTVSCLQPEGQTAEVVPLGDGDFELRISGEPKEGVVPGVGS
jgi:hypothetical protein